MSTVLVREIESYEVIVQRSSKTALRRVLRLALKPLQGNPVTSAEIAFEPGPSGLGDMSDATPLFHLPSEDFGDSYHVLQTEKPVHIAASADNQGKVIYVGLTTSPEALGEGFEDADA